MTRNPVVSFTLVLLAGLSLPPAAVRAQVTPFCEAHEDRGKDCGDRELPAILSIAPNSGQPGQQKMAVTITGRHTHFAQGATTADFGPGTSVAALTVKSATSITAVLNLDWATPTGTRDVTLKSGTETVRRAGGFAIQSRALGSFTSVLPVLKFAKCDGSTDDTASLQAAMNAAASANTVLQLNVPLPCVSGPLNAPAGLVLAGPGTIQQKAGTGASPLLLITGNNVTISGVTFDGHLAGHAGESLIFVKNASLFFFENNTLTHTVNGQYGLRLMSTTNSRVAGNTLKETAGPGIAVNDGCSYVMVSDNSMDHTSAQWGGSAYTAQSGSTNGIHDVIFARNRAIESVHFCFEAGNFLHNSTDASIVHDVLFTENTCKIANTTGTNDCGSTISPAACGGYSFSVMSNSSITANTYDATGQSVGIAAIEMTGCSACNATGNTLAGGTASSQRSEGITANCNRCVISDNQITNWSPSKITAGIEIHTVSDLAFQSADDNVVTGNRITMPAGSNWVKGIYINCNNHGAAAPSINRTVISGNTISGAGPGNGAGIAVLQNDSACALDRSVVNDNTISRVSSGIQLSGGTNYTVQNNQVSDVTVPLSMNGGVTFLSSVASGIPLATLRGQSPVEILAVEERTTREIPAGSAPVTISPGPWVSTGGYGAKCDGESDDTSALQNAIWQAARENVALRIEGPSACMTGPLTIAGPVQIFGPGVLKQTGGTSDDAFVSLTGSGIRISGLTIDGGSTGRSGDVLIYAKDAAMLVFENNTVKNTGPGEYSFRAINLSDSLLMGNTFQSIRGPGIAVDDGSHRVRVEGNRVDHSEESAGGVSSSGLSANVTDVSGSPISDIRFSNNMINGSVRFCIESGNRKTGSADPTLVSNIIFDSNRCAMSTSGVRECTTVNEAVTCGGYFMGIAENSSVLGNSYTGTGQAAAIAGIEVSGCSRCLVYGNSLQGSEGNASGRSIGISANCARCLIANNEISGVGDRWADTGIYIRTTSSFPAGADTAVTGNRVALGSGGGTGVSIECLHAGGRIDRLVIMNNTIAGRGSGTGVTATGKPGCRLDSAILGGNVIRGTKTGYQFSDALRAIYQGAEYRVVLTNPW